MAPLPGIPPDSITNTNITVNNYINNTIINNINVSITNVINSGEVCGCEAAQPQGAMRHFSLCGLLLCWCHGSGSSRSAGISETHA